MVVDTISYESICLLWLTKHHVWTSESQRTERLSSLPDVIVLVVDGGGGGDESGHDGKCDPQYLRSGTSYRVATDRPNDYCTKYIQEEYKQFSNKRRRGQGKPPLGAMDGERRECVFVGGWVSPEVPGNGWMASSSPEILPSGTAYSSSDNSSPYWYRVEFFIV